MRAILVVKSLTEVEAFRYSRSMKRNETGEDRWEQLCEKCGLCCFEKIEDESGAIFFTSTPCRYLDVVTRECKIYHRRFEIYPACISLTEEMVRNLSWLHDECGYRKALGLTRKR